MILLDDLKLIKGNTKGLIFILFFRLSSFFATRGLALKIVGLPIRVFYRFFFQWILGTDIPDTTKIGAGFCVWHGQGIVIHKTCIIGRCVHVRQNTTIGHKREGERAPMIGDNVDIGAHALIIGDISIGDNCVIGAGTFVNKNIPARSIVYGNPFVIKKQSVNEE